MQSKAKGRHRTEKVGIDRAVRIGDLSFRIRGLVAPVTEGATGYLLVHGVGMSYRTMAGMKRILATSTPVFSVDLAGFDGCPVPRRTVTVRQMATALGRMCDEAGVRSFIVVGHSMGSQWAVELAASRPDLVVGAVLIGPVIDREHRTLRRQALGLAVDVLYEPPLTSLRVLADFLRAGSRWYTSQVRQMVTYPIDERIEEVRVPILVLRGRSDKVAGSGWCRLLRDQAQDAEFITIPRAAHNVQVSRPRPTAEAVEDFACRRIAPTRTTGQPTRIT